MEDNTTKEPQASTSKKECQEEHSSHELRDKKGHDDDRSNNDSWSTGSYSVKSRIEMAKAKVDTSKALDGKRDSKPAERRKRGNGDKRRRGRVDKRKRSVTRRQPVRRPLKRKLRIERKRDLSVSTIFTRLSPDSPRRSRSPSCQYCGHRCCLRRYQNKSRRMKLKRNKRKNKQRMEKKKTLRSECLQAGSRCMMLSPLFINTNSTPAPDVMSPSLKIHAEVTPEMIHETLQKLTMWKQGASIHSIVCHLMRTYPVNLDENQLITELKEKLRIAVFVGIAAKLSADTWCLSSALENRTLKVSHITMFWKIYSDTLKPIKKEHTVANEERHEDNQTNTASIVEDRIEIQYHFI